MGLAPRGSQLDDWVDRPEVEARQRVQLTGTNRPSGLASTPFDFASTVRFPRYGRQQALGPVTSQ